MTTDAAPSRAEVETQLARILAHKVFLTTDRLSEFLRFVVEETLAGRQHQIKGYTVATRVFGRPDDFDPVVDPIVRIQAGRLRRRLGSYYADEGRDDPVRIEIPTGGYVPRFTAATGTDASRDRSSGIGGGPTTDSGAASVAVMPLAFIGDDPEFGYLADGVVEEVAAALTRYDGLTVVGRQSTLPYATSGLSIIEVAHALGVRFMITGSIRLLDRRLRVAVQLTDASDGTQLWAQTVERDLSVTGLFELQDEITRLVVARIGDEYGVIPRHVFEESRDKLPDELSTYEATLRFYHYNLHPGKASHALAMAALQQAVDKEPEYALAWAQLAELYVDSEMLGFEGPQTALEEAHRAAHRATALDSRCQQARSTMAYVHFAIGEYETARREAEAAIELNPNRAYQVAASAFWLGLSGDRGHARSIIDDIEKLNPHQPGWLRLVAFLDHLDRDEYAEAEHEALRFRSPQLAWDPLLRAAAAGLQDKERPAASAWRELSELFPEVGSDPASYIRAYVRADTHVNTLLKGIEKAAAAAGSRQENRISDSSTP